MPDLKTGYVPGVLGTITQMHAQYYADLVGFGAAFETTVASGMVEFIPRLDNPLNQIWSVIDNGQILGSISIDGQDLGSNIAHLRWFIISDSLRGGGWGTKLLQAALAHCDKIGFAETHLWTFAGLDAARRLYETTGFVLTEEYEGNQWGNRVTEQKFIRPAP